MTPSALSPAPRVPVLLHAHLRGWPKNEKGGSALYLTLGDALARAFPTDAHFCAYSFRRIARRLTSEALSPATRSKLGMRPRQGVPMVAAVFDVDAEAAHAATGGTPGTTAGDDWWVGELPKLDALAAAHPGLFFYRTRGGYRVLGVLPEPFVLCAPADAEAWKIRYWSWCFYLCRRFGIVSDPSCADWTRLYRLPHATRDEGGKPERRETRGDPARIGAWTCDPTAEDLEAARKLLPRERAAARPRKEKIEGRDLAPAGTPGILYHAFRARGWLGGEIESGKWAVVCPNEAAHSKGSPLDGSTILWAPHAGETLGWLHCSHGHCQGRDLRDVLALFSPAELDAARAAAGIVAVAPPPPPPAKTTRTCHVDDLDRELPAIYREASEWTAAAPGRVGVFDISLGAGKTREALRDLARGDRRATILAPSHTLADEHEATYQGFAGDDAPIRRHEGTERRCILPAREKKIAVAAAGPWGLRAVACGKCPLRETCPAHDPLGPGQDIATHAHAEILAARGELRGVGIYDEALALLDTRNATIEDLRVASGTHADPELAAAVAPMRDIADVLILTAGLADAEQLRRIGEAQAARATRGGKGKRVWTWRLFGAELRRSALEAAADLACDRGKLPTWRQARIGYTPDPAPTGAPLLAAAIADARCAARPPKPPMLDTAAVLRGEDLDRSPWPRPDLHQILQAFAGELDPPAMPGAILDPAACIVAAGEEAHPRPAPGFETRRRRGEAWAEAERRNVERLAADVARGRDRERGRGAAYFAAVTAARLIVDPAREAWATARDAVRAAAPGDRDPLRTSASEARRRLSAALAAARALPVKAPTLTYRGAPVPLGDDVTLATVRGARAELRRDVRELRRLRRDPRRSYLILDGTAGWTNAATRAALLGRDVRVFALEVTRPDAPVSRCHVRAATARHRILARAGLGTYLVGSPLVARMIQGAATYTRDTTGMSAPTLGLVAYQAAAAAVGKAWEATADPAARAAILADPAAAGPLLATLAGLRDARLIAELEVGHFGGVRGLNRFRACDGLLLIGVPTPNRGAVGEDARALGIGGKTLVDALTGAETAQAIARVRELWTSTPRAVIVASPHSSMPAEWGDAEPDLFAAVEDEASDTVDVVDVPGGGPVPSLAATAWAALLDATAAELGVVGSGLGRWLLEAPPPLRAEVLVRATDTKGRHNPVFTILSIRGCVGLSERSAEREVIARYGGCPAATLPRPSGRGCWVVRETRPGAAEALRAAILAYRRRADPSAELAAVPHVEAPTAPAVPTLIPDLSGIPPAAVALAELVAAVPTTAAWCGLPMPPADPGDPPSDWALLAGMVALAGGSGLDGDEARCAHGERAGALAESVAGGLDPVAAGLAARLEARGIPTGEAVRYAGAALADARARAAPWRLPTPPLRAATSAPSELEPAAVAAG
ncbi:MAG: hypothetical protein HYZ53_24715 [Planctomycetes bacterium]|nr:hypothetical protein [Planctomycetota bacterium]